MSQDRADRLQKFADWSAQHITGDEKGQAQIFLDRLFQAFGQPGSLDVGGKPEFRIKPGKEDAGGTSFADYVWKPIVLIEMKKRGIDLTRTRQQAFDYWIKLVPNRPRYTILCNFDEFWIYDFNLDIEEPLDKLKLSELPKRYDPLAFLFPTQERPVFNNNRVEVTRNAADRLAVVFNEIALRTGDRPLAQRFALQSLVALFAEDIDLLPRHFFTNLLADCKSPEDSYDLIGGLFEAMNRPNGTPAGRFKGVRYFNGGLFAEPARVALSETEIAHLKEAAKQDWSKVSPDIFGTLFQHSMDQPERHAFGAHYTAPIDIMKIVNPTIVEPWTKLIDAAKKPAQLADLLERLALYTVLDPACGSGNFLYLAYRELKRLETKIRDRLRTEFPDFQAPLTSIVTARQFHGMDILPFAIELAKVTMMLARKLAIDELHIADEPPLPLDNLDQNFQCVDALRIYPPPFDPKKNWQPSVKEVHAHFTPIRTPWPAADVIIGNPPFLDARKMTKEYGRKYVKEIENLYPDVPRRADYCTYWLRRAHDHLPVCTPERPQSGRAGLVGTQNIRNNEAREGGLDHIVKTGTIIEAVENQPWSGEANVHVSIANWVKTAPSVAASHRDGVTTDPPTTTDVPPPPASQPPKTKGTRSVSAGPTTTPQPTTSPAQAAKNPPATTDPTKLLIPINKKLWHKVDPKLALFNQNKKNKASAVTTTGKSGKTLSSKSYELDFRETLTINSALSDAIDVAEARILSVNRSPKKCFEGQQPGHKGFRLTTREAYELRQKEKVKEILFPYANGDDLLSGNFVNQPDFIIDFGERNLLEASAFPIALKIVKTKVLAKWQQNAEEEKSLSKKETGEHQKRLQTWWRLKRRRQELLDSIADLKRYVVCSRVTKRPIFSFLCSSVHPDSSLSCFAFDDEYSFGVLQSHAHWLWLTTKGSKLKSDFRYTPDTVFDTFPWPQSPTKKQIDAIAAAGREIRKVRADALQKITGGLRALYRTLELPGQNPLKSAHATLDTAVLNAYNFSPTQDLLAQLLQLNLQVAANLDENNAVTAPGIPPTYINSKDLVSNDCIQP